MTKTTSELVPGDVVLKDNGAVLMTIRRVAQAVDPHFLVVWCFGPRGGKQRSGYEMNRRWTVREGGA